MVRRTPDDVEEPSPAAPAAKAPPAPAESTESSESHSRPRRRRWLLRLTLIVLALLLLLAVAIQLVLWSNLPKRLVLNQLQSQLGLRVQASSLTTGWLGNTNLREVTLALPMAEQSFLDMPKMRVKHTSIFGLLLRRPVSVDLIALENPTLYVRRDAAGRWNLAEVAELVARAGGKKPADEAASQARPKLPEVVIDRATVVVEDYDQKPRTEIHPLNLHGRPDPKTPGILWRYDMEVPGHVKLVGQVAPGAPWAHEVGFTVDKVYEWAHPWVTAFPQDARVAAQWRGKLGGDGRLTARLDVEELKVAGIGSKGVVNVSDEGNGRYALRPDGLLVTTPQKLLPEAKVASGTISVDGTGVRAERVQVAAVGGQVRLDGNLAFATTTGQVAAEWTDVATGVVTSSGSLQATLAAPFPDRPKVDATLAARGTGPDGAFDTTMVLSGNGRRGWTDMDWTLNAPNLDWRGNYPLQLDGLFARVETRPDPRSGEAVVRLASLQAPNQRIESIGEYNLTRGNWKLWVALGNVPAPGAEAVKQEAAGSGAGQGQGAPQASAMLNVWGDRGQVRIEQFLLRGAEAELWANGWYRYDRPNPLDVNVHLKHIPPRRDELDRPPIFGFLRGQATVQGTLFQPRNLSIEGELNGEGVTAFRRPVKDIKVKVTGHLGNDRGELKTEEFELLKSRWALDALYTRQNRSLTVGVRVPDLDLREVGDLLQPVGPDDRQTARKDEPRTDFLSGTLAGQWKVDVLGAGIDRVRVNGNVTARNVKASAFAADEVQATTTLDGGVLTVGPVRMRRAVTRTAQGGGKVNIDGRGEASVRVDTKRPGQVTLSLSLASWPLQLGDSAWVDLSGGSKQLVLDLASKANANQRVLPGKTAVGELQLASNLTYAGVPLGDSELRATLMGREIDLRKFRLSTLDGALEGQGVIELEKPLEARAFFRWDKIRAARLVELFPALKGLEGTYTGSARVQPSRDPRALGPLAFDMQMEAQGGRYKTIQIGKGQVLGYADLTRVVLNDPADIPTMFEVGGGLLTMWGRVSYHNLETTKDAVSSQFMLDFQGLDLNQIVHAAAPNYDDSPGRLDGTITLVGATRGPRLRPLPAGVPKPSFPEKLVTAFMAEGRVRLQDAKLGRIPIFSDLYNLMHLGQDVKENAGRGEVQVRLENGGLELNNLRYFNRGTEVRAQFRIERLWELPESPIAGNAVGSSRPLASIELPFVSEADRILALLQNDLLSVGVKGTVAKPNIYQQGLADIGTGLREVLLGDVREVKGNAKR